MTTTERALRRALQRGDRVAAILLAQRLWHAGDIRRTAIVGNLRNGQPIVASNGECIA